MRLMTYNILTGGRDEDGSSRLDSVLQVIREARPDVLALQECNGFNAHGHSLLHHFERELGMRGALAIAPTGFHVALFVRGCKLRQTFPLQRELHHAGLVMRLERHGRPLTVLCAHLCPFGGHNRLGEVSHLIRYLRDTEPCVVMGDLNSLSPADAASLDTSSWSPRRRCRHFEPGAAAPDTRAVGQLLAAGLHDLCPASERQPTCQTPLRLGHEHYQLRIDFILGSRSLEASARGYVRIATSTSQTASDHFPVCVDVEP